MRRRDFLIGLPVSAFIAASHSRGQLLPPPQPSPAVVNPVFRSIVRPWLSLDGEWDFSLDPKDEGLDERWFSPNHWQAQNPLLRKINVPGAWEAQGVGKPGLSHSTAREFARIPLHNEYVGIAWYRKDLTVPRGWEGKRAWLKIGGVDSKGLFWFNGEYLGYLHNYTSGGYKFDVTPFLKIGENTVIVRVDNKLNSRKGAAVSRDQFGGLYRGVELEATSQAYLEDAWVRPDFDNKRAIVNVTVAAPWLKRVSGDYRIVVQVYALPEGKRAGQGQLAINGFSYTGAEIAIPIVLNPFVPWSPEHPFLYKAEISLEQMGNEIDGWGERFGVRKIERCGPDICLNGKRYFLRGFGDDYVYPLTLSSPSSLEYHRQHLALARAYGFNYVRHHTHVENPEYFEAADEVGIMIQAGLPYEGIRPSPPGPYQPLDDLNELHYHYRRYVSLTTYSMGNEGLHEEGYRQTLFKAAKMLDPTRLALHQDGGVNYEGISDFRGGPLNVPITKDDVTGSMPVILHEYLNLSGPPDPRLEPLFTGAEASPFHLEQSKEEVQKLGLEWALVERAIDGGHELQSIYQKLGLENARSVPGLDGYDYWTIVDFLALMPQGLLDPFWRPKRSSAGYFRQFNSAIALLLPNLSPYGVDRVFMSGDSVSHALSCSNYSEDGISNATISWTFENKERVYSRGQLDSISVPQGTVTQMGHLEFQMPVVDRPLELILRVRLGSPEIDNQWKFYCFPRQWTHAKLHAALTTDTIYHQLRENYPGLRLVEGDASRRHYRPEELYITTRMDENAFRLLEEGAKVLLLSLADFSPAKVGARMGWWWPRTNQRGTALAETTAFAGFPAVDGMPNPALFRLFYEALELDERLANQVDTLALTLGAGKDVISVLETPPWAGQSDVSESRSSSYLMNVFQARVGRGRLLASGFDLLSGKPEANYMLDILLKYVESSHFEPKNAISADDLRRMITVVQKS